MSSTEEVPIRNSRRLLHMVRELHTMGYEQLRIIPNVAPSGMFWRVSISAASNTLPEHGAKMRDLDEGAHYSSSDLDNYFGWNDAADNSPAELVQKFIERFPDLAEAGKGDDSAYVRWFDDMLRATEPDGLPYAAADWPTSDDCLSIFNASTDAEIPLPPPYRNSGK